MGWHKTSQEGKTLWERSDGVRLRSTYDIDAFEKREREEYLSSTKKREQLYFRNNQEELDEIDEDWGEMSPIHAVILILMILILIINVVFF